MDVSSLNLRPVDRGKMPQPKTRALLDDLQNSIEFGSVEPKITNGKITHITVIQTVKAID